MRGKRGGFVEDIPAIIGWTLLGIAVFLLVFGILTGKITSWIDFFKNMLKLGI